jgi:ubiquinone/menaquinone biosynthesis C-methylase UbiE
MDDAAQAKAYAQADFSEPNSLFLDKFRQTFPSVTPRRVLDLGCGPGDISCRFAEAYPDARVTGIDGASAMLVFARELASHSPAIDRVQFIHATIQALDHGEYDTLLSNSLLHHLADPDALWAAIKRVAKPGASVLVMDLMRPESQAAAQLLVDTYASSEPEVLRRDFFNSLCAAFSTEEVREQLSRAELDNLSVESVSDRHMLIQGTV